MILFVMVAFLILALPMPATSLNATFVGDSITQGNDWENSFTNLTVSNQGVSGDTTAGVDARIGNIAATHPDYIFLMVGINDLIHQYRSVAAMNGYMDSILHTACTDSDGANVVVFSILPAYGAYVGNNDAAISANSHTEYECGKYSNCRYVDLRYLYNNTDGYQADGLHLTHAGYYAWEEQVFEIINSDTGGGGSWTGDYFL
jgi:lysophospholipase L1-like esterase